MLRLCVWFTWLACSRNTCVQLVHGMPKDRREQLRSSLKTNVKELSGGTHFLVVYYCPHTKTYQGVSSDSWLPVLKSEELSDVLHTATNTISCDPADLEWCQGHCSSLDEVFRHIPRKWLKNSLTHLKWVKIRQKARDKIWQDFNDTSADFGAATEKRVAMNERRKDYKEPKEKQGSLVNAQQAWRDQGAVMPPNHVRFQDFIHKHMDFYTPNDWIAALGLTLQHYNPNHFDTNEPSKDLTMAFHHLARSWNMECHEKELARPGADDDDSDSDTAEAQSSCPWKVWLALVNGVLFPMSTMKRTPFNVNSHSQRSNSASFRGPSGNNPWAVLDDCAEQQRPSESSASGSKKPSPHSNFQAWCVQNKHLLLSQDQLAALKGEVHCWLQVLMGETCLGGLDPDIRVASGCAGPALFKEVNQRLRTAADDEVQAWKNQYQEYLQSVPPHTSLPSSSHAPPAGGTRVCELFKPVTWFDLFIDCLVSLRRRCIAAGGVHGSSICQENPIPGISTQKYDKRGTPDCNLQPTSPPHTHTRHLTPSPMLWGGAASSCTML